MKTLATMTPGSKTSQLGSRELVWKTADGTEKRLELPIEMIKEDAMEDPEFLLSQVDRDEVPEEEWNKMIA